MKQTYRTADRARASGTQAVHRALKVLRIIARGRDAGVSLSTLCEESGLNKSTAHRLASALVEAGMVQQNETTRQYFLGAECYALGLVAGSRFGLHHDVEGPVRELAQQSGDAAFFSLRQGAWALCLLRHEGDYPIKSHVLQAGDRHPLGVGGGNLAMLAALDDADVELALDLVMPEIELVYPQHSRTWLMGQVDKARERGFAVNPGLVLKGSWGIGVAVRDPHGDVLGAFSIATVESRITPDREAMLAQMLATQAQALEALLVTRSAQQDYGPFFSMSADQTVEHTKRHNHDPSNDRGMVAYSVRQTG